MRLVSLHVENFGILHDLDETFDSGLNVRLQPNGYGKSTLAVFIKSMLYGLPANRSRSLIENERKRYTPWQGGAYGGSLDIEVGGELYRIERLFGAKESDDTLCVRSLKTGEIARQDWAVSPGERLLGVGIAAYERSTYLSQRPDDMTKSGMAGIHAKLNDLGDTEHDLAAFDAAMTALEHRRLHYALLKGRGGAVADSEDAIAALDVHIERSMAARAAWKVALTRVEEAKREISSLDSALAECQQKQSALHRAREAKAIEERIGALEREEAALREQIAVLREGLGGSVPTEAMIESLEGTLSLRDEAQRRMGAGLDEQEAQEYAELRARLGDQPPTPALLTTLRECAKEYNRAAVLSAAAGYAIGAQEVSPTQYLNECRLAQDNRRAQHEQLTARRAALQHTPTGHRARLGLLCLSGAVALGLVIGGLWKAPLLMVGAALAVATLGVAALCRTRDARRLSERQDALARLEADIAVLESSLRAGETVIETAECGVRFAACWAQTQISESCPQPLDAPLQTELLAAQCDRLRTLETKLARTKETSAESQALLAHAEATIRALLSPMPSAPADAARALRWLTEQRGLLLDHAERYERKKNEVAQLRAQYDTQGEAHRAALTLIEETDEQALLAERTALTNKRTLWAEALLREQQSVDRLRAEADELDELENERARRQALLEEQKNNLDAILQAEKYLTLARESLSGRYLATMKERFGYYMGLLTGKDAPAFTMDGQFRVKLRAAGVGRDAEAFSVGMRDLIALCERLALLDVMFEGERPFLVLDDPFTNLDDETIERAHALLAAVSERYQLIYLTCHSGRVPQ